ncbi:hypothetical protein [Methylobacterium mesophilicum]|uniref:hypothetical protein n=1 Tax=Methylobacterium mesophilicum TaxID=39956 RepID=UPI002F2E9D71
MHARIELTYAATLRIEGMARPEREQLARLLPTLDVPLGDELPAGWCVPWDQRAFTVDLLEVGPKLIELGVVFEVHRFLAGEGNA